MVLAFWIIPSDKMLITEFKTRLEFGFKDVEIHILSVSLVRCVQWRGGVGRLVRWPRCEMWPVADRRLQDGLVLPYPGRDSPRLQIPVLTRPMLSPPLPELLPYHRHRHATLTCFCCGSCVKNELPPGLRSKKFREMLWETLTTSSSRISCSEANWSTSNCSIFGEQRSSSFSVSSHVCIQSCGNVPISIFNSG